MNPTRRSCPATTDRRSTPRRRRTPWRRSRATDRPGSASPPLRRRRQGLLDVRRPWDGGLRKIQPPPAAVSSVLDAREPVAGIKIGGGRVLRGGDEVPFQPVVAAAGGPLGHEREQRGFRGPADDAAAEEERVQIRAAIVAANNRHPDDAVVGETIDQLQ